MPARGYPREDMGSRGGALVLGLVVGLGAGYGLRPVLERRAGRAVMPTDAAPAPAQRATLPDPASAPPAPALPSARTPLAPTTGAGASGAASRDGRKVEIASVDEARARLEQLLRGGGRGSDIARLLRQVKAIGTPEAHDLLLETMEREDVPVQSPLWAQLLSDVEDARVQETALRVLRRNTSEGLTSWVDTQGFVDLIGSRLDAQGAAALLELLREGDQAGNRAAKWARELLPYASADELLSLEVALPDLYESLASTQDPTVHESLLAVCLRDDARTRARGASRNAAQALGKWTAEGALAADVSLLSSRGETDLVLDLLVGARHNERLTPAQRSAVGWPVLLEALGDPARASEALDLLASDASYHGPACAAALERLLLEGPPELQGATKRVLRAVRRSLGQDER